VTEESVPKAIVNGRRVAIILLLISMAGTRHTGQLVHRLVDDSARDLLNQWGALEGNPRLARLQPVVRR